MLHAPPKEGNTHPLPDRRLLRKVHLFALPRAMAGWPRASAIASGATRNRAAARNVPLTVNMESSHHQL